MKLAGITVLSPILPKLPGGLTRAEYIKAAKAEEFIIRHLFYASLACTQPGKTGL